jgi:mRNA interferase RelE/StbE
MEPFEIRWRTSTRKDLKGIPASEVARIIAAVEALADDPFPHGVEKLSGSVQTFRIRIGDYRVVYEVFTDQRIIEIERVRHRKDAYRP